MVIGPGAPITTGSGPYQGVWTVVMPASATAGIDPGLASWALWRTDVGSSEVLAAGTLLVLAGG